MAVPWHFIYPYVNLKWLLRVAFHIPFPTHIYVCCKIQDANFLFPKYLEEESAGRNQVLGKHGAKQRTSLGRNSHALIREYPLDSLSLGLLIHKQHIIWGQKNRMLWTESQAGTKIPVREYWSWSSFSPRKSPSHNRLEAEMVPAGKCRTWRWPSPGFSHCKL